MSENAPGVPFKKGGDKRQYNKGRPKKSEQKPDEKIPSRAYAKTCAQRQTKTILDTWIEIMTDPKQQAKDRITAAQLLWHAGWGKPGISRDEQSNTENALNNLPQVVLATIKQADSEDDKPDED